MKKIILTYFYKVKRKIRKIKFQHHVKNIERSRFEALIKIRNSSLKILDNNLSCEAIIFSKDRAMQLHALLETYKQKVKYPFTLNILYTYSNIEHEKTYESLIEQYSSKSIKFIVENNFRQQLLEIVSNISASKLFFLCDDQFFKEDFDVKDITKFNPYLITPSLNRGLDTTRNIGRVNELPQFKDNIIADNDKKCWIWKENPQSLDWAYPLSVGGVIFSTKEMLLLLEMIDFKGPNSLEGNLQKYLNIFSDRYGICYEKAVLGSIPCNLVNTEVKNKIVETYSVDELLIKWNNGYRIKYEDLYGRSWDDLLYAKFEFVKREAN